MLRMGFVKVALVAGDCAALCTAADFGKTIIEMGKKGNKSLNSGAVIGKPVGEAEVLVDSVNSNMVATMALRCLGPSPLSSPPTNTPVSRSAAVCGASQSLGGG